MRTIALVALIAASACWAQEPAPNSNPIAGSVQAPAPAVASNGTIVIPEGTHIALSLTSAITNKARPGTSVRAVTAFPVTVGTQFAIPVGTYVEGAIDKVSKGGRTGPTVQVHFTRVLFANGYSLPVAGKNIQADASRPRTNPEEHASLATTDVPRNSFNGQPQLPSIQPPSSHMGTAIGVGLGSLGAVVAFGVLMHHHSGSVGGVLFDTGWQFEMVLERPLAVDAASVAAATRVQ